MRSVQVVAASLIKNGKNWREVIKHFYIKKDWRCMLEEIDRIGGMLSNKVALRFLF